MTRLRGNRLIFWLLMLCIGLQGIGSAVHRVSHESHVLGHPTRPSAATALQHTACADHHSAVNFEPACADGKTDKAATPAAELCLVCASYSQAKAPSLPATWLAETSFQTHHGDGKTFCIIVAERLLFALPRAPPTDLS